MTSVTKQTVKVVDNDLHVIHWHVLVIITQMHVLEITYDTKQVEATSATVTNMHTATIERLSSRYYYYAGYYGD